MEGGGFGGCLRDNKGTSFSRNHHWGGGWKGDMMVMVQGEGVGRVVVCGDPRLYGGCRGWVKEVERWCWIGEVGGLL